MPVDERDQLWNAVFDTYYYTYFEEIVAERLIQAWERLDVTTRVLIAVTASGSAVSSWALWNTGGFREFWAVIAGIAALLALIHAPLSVSERMKIWLGTRRRLAALRVDLETMRQEMSMNPMFDVGAFSGRFLEYRKAYSQCVQQLPSDVLITKKLRASAQTELNEQLGLKEH